MEYQYVTTTPHPIRKSLNQRNIDGRGYPDIVAQGSDLTIVLDIVSRPKSGTSCSAPIIAGLLALANDALIDASGDHSHSLGWINPWLYKNGANGDVGFEYPEAAPPGSSFDGCDIKGFPIAGDKWNPVSGWGSPVGSALSSWYGS